MRERPKEHEVYRHFKGRYYQVIAVARHTEYDEELVIYRPLFEGGEVYARPLESFMSEVDREAYPNARQKYRFMLATGESHGGKSEKETEDNTPKPVEERPAYVNGAIEEEVSDQKEIYDHDRNPDSLLDPDLEAFLDEKSVKKKIDILMFMRKRMTEDMLNTISVALDIRLTGENLEDRYMEILDFLKTKNKYESDRLR
ncbi:MAG: DUF1653 domain-containing protein [Lachnospiraceae bacterium]|nr:DUF1653 domain-containing protein [Lachnospiraceae bacterium]